MSDKDALVGTLMRQRLEGLNRKAAIEAELRQVAETLVKLIRKDRPLTTEQRRMALQPVEQYFNTELLFKLLDERDRIQEQIVDAIQQLREMGSERHL